MQDTNAAAEFSPEINMAIALRELGAGCEGIAAALEGGLHVPEGAIRELEQTTEAVVGQLRALLKAAG